MKKQTVKAHKKASRKSFEKILIRTTTKVIKNKKKDVKPFLTEE